MSPLFFYVVSARAVGSLAALLFVLIYGQRHTGQIHMGKKRRYGQPRQKLPDSYCAPQSGLNSFIVYIGLKSYFAYSYSGFHTPVIIVLSFQVGRRRL